MTSLANHLPRLTRPPLTTLTITTTTTQSTTTTTAKAKDAEKADIAPERAKDTAHRDLLGSQDVLGHSHASPSPPAKVARKAKEAPQPESVEDIPADAMENPTTQMTLGMITGMRTKTDLTTTYISRL